MYSCSLHTHMTSDKCHIKLCSPTLQIMSPFMIHNFSKSQSLLRFGMLYWGRKEDNSNKTIFRMQKKMIRSVIGINSRTSLKKLFNEIKIPALTSLCMYVCMCVYIFIHLVVCLTTGSKPLTKRALHIVRSRASSLK